jgi:hypothetical protein
MLIASQYALLSEDKKTHTRKTLDELVTRETPPLSSEELDELIHRSMF